jgi:hypothetical protein
VLFVLTIKKKTPPPEGEGFDLFSEKSFTYISHKEIDMADIKSICSYAKNSELLVVKVKSLQSTLAAYKIIQREKSLKQEDILKQNSDLHKSIIELQADKELYRETLKALSKTYKIPEKTIEATVNYVEHKLKDDRDNSPRLQLKK